MRMKLIMAGNCSLGGRLAAADALRIQLEASLQSRISHVMEKIEQGMNGGPFLSISTCG